MTGLTTPRLTVRRVALADAAAVFAARAAMPFDPPTRDFAATQAMIAEAAAKDPASDGWHQFAIVATATAAVLGDIGVRRGHPGPCQATLGFALLPEARGRASRPRRSGHWSTSCSRPGSTGSRR